MCHCNDTRMERTPNKSPQREFGEKKISRRLCRGLNQWLSDYESDSLPTELSRPPEKQTKRNNLILQLEKKKRTRSTYLLRLFSLARMSLVKEVHLLISYQDHPFQPRACAKGKRRPSRLMNWDQGRLSDMLLSYRHPRRLWYVGAHILRPFSLSGVERESDLQACNLTLTSLSPAPHPPFNPESFKSTSLNAYPVSTGTRGLFQT